ncbi:hypothetical protein PAHAL_8G111400 [Panicum hallii]|uniref:Uncharacterized protein n=1 Tax=Panicum hallii TaxID=206008 RepID=A0A2T8I8H2_9POAL|nr:hypothetical protein PAHAL_8G111400 [Panicum hallii]
MFRSCSEGLVIMDWIRSISIKQVSSHYYLHTLFNPKVRSGIDAISSLQPIPGRSDEPITARTNLYKCLCLQEFHESHLPDQVQDQVARLATPSQGVRQIAGPLTEGPGPASRPGSLPAPRVAYRCLPVGFDRQHIFNGSLMMKDSLLSSVQPG